MQQSRAPATEDPPRPVPIDAVQAELVGVAEIAPNEEIDVLVGHRTRVATALVNELRLADENPSAPDAAQAQVSPRVLLLLVKGLSPSLLQDSAATTPSNYGPEQAALHDVLLRVAASLKGAPAAAESADLQASLTIGGLVLDLGAHRAWVDGEEAMLTALEFRLLRMLCERRDTVHTRPALLRSVWGGRGLENTRTVDTHVKRLRSKLKRAGVYIQTVRGVGYRLSSPR